MVQFELRWPLHYRLKFNSAKRKRSRVEFPSYKNNPPIFFGVHFIYIKKGRYEWIGCFSMHGSFFTTGD